MQLSQISVTSCAFAPQNKHFDMRDGPGEGLRRGGGVVGQFSNRICRNFFLQHDSQQEFFSATYTLSPCFIEESLRSRRARSGAPHLQL